MRKILIILLIVLMIILAYSSIFSGLSIFNFRVYAMKEIEETNIFLQERIDENKQLVEIEFNKKIDELNSSSNNLKKAKQEYEAIANSYTEEEIKKASTVGEYKSEFIWVALGNYATVEGLTGKFDLTESSNGTPDAQDIMFTLIGSYSGITDFIYDIENDEELKFKIENFELVPGEQGVEALQATFSVKDVSITN